MTIRLNIGTIMVMIIVLIVGFTFIHMESFQMPTMLKHRANEEALFFCNPEAFLNMPSIEKKGYLLQTQNISVFDALQPVLPHEHPQTRGWDNEAFDAVNKFFWGMENGIVLELGGLDGRRYSMSADFLPLKWHRVLVEASPRYTKVGVNRSSDATYIAAAVCNLDHVHYLFSSNEADGAINGIGEFMSAKFFYKFHKEIFEATDGGRDWSSKNWSAWALQHETAVVEVPCLSLNKIIKCLKTSHINFLVLDVEGGELSVLNTVDFENVKIDVICVETDPQYRPQGYGSEVALFLQRRGFVKEFDKGRNSWFRRKTYQANSRDAL